MKTDQAILTALCPDCEMEISVGAVLQPGDRVTCPDCWAALVVTDLEPLELKWDLEEFDEDDWKEE